MGRQVKPKSNPREQNKDNSAETEVSNQTLDEDALDDMAELQQAAPPTPPTNTPPPNP